jgi:hypothetical protein
MTCLWARCGKLSNNHQGKRLNDKRDKLLHLSSVKEVEPQQGIGDFKRHVLQSTGDNRSVGQGSDRGYHQGSGQEVPSSTGPLSSPFLDHLL